ncbi:MAG: PEP-CTERM sorting domain-containing protein [Lentisphaerae bacterium]|nr:PEP-CTERM sorting domain-containing protein [Lentisphaerota bacterium]
MHTITGSGAAPAYSLTFTTVPEPSAGGLLALAGVVGLWRRRRRA